MNYAEAIVKTDFHFSELKPNLANHNSCKQPSIGSN